MDKGKNKKRAAHQADGTSGGGSGPATAEERETIATQSAQAEPAQAEPAQTAGAQSSTPTAEDAPTQDVPVSRGTLAFFALLAVLVVGQMVLLTGRATNRPTAAASGSASKGIAAPTPTPMQFSRLIVHGVIKAVDDKIALKHDEIPELRMAAGTTRFMATKAVLAAFGPGSEVDVFLDLGGKEPVIDKIFLMPDVGGKASASPKASSPGSAPSARGAAASDGPTASPGAPSTSSQTVD